MNYLSVCSGIEAATSAWHPLGWNPVGFSEIEAFPSAVLKHHYPTVPNFGDMTKYKEWNINGTVELLVGGTPCQSFSVAGLRKGLEDPRGNLALVYCGILDHFRPKWFIWENVPGVLSSNKGGDFGSFLGAVAELGYGFAYRVLDAQYFGVPQRRRRVFVVGCLGDWVSPAKVLFERESLRRNTPPSREKRQGTASFSPSSFGNYCEGVGTLRRDGGDLGGGSETLVTFDRQSSGEYGVDPVASTISARDYKSATDLIVYETHPADSRVKEMGETCQTVTSRWGTGGGNVPLVQSYSIREDAQANNFSATPLEVTPALQALRPSVQSHHAQTFIAHAFKIRGGSPVETGEYGGTPGKAAGKGYLGSDEKAFTLSATQDQQIAFNTNARPDEMKFETDVSGTLTRSQSAGVMQNMAVRRLTPTECERLQGFPDGHTDIPWKGKEAPDSPRYKALGNSMAVPVMSWIGKRIQLLEDGSL